MNRWICEKLAALKCLGIRCKNGGDEEDPKGINRWWGYWIQEEKESCGQSISVWFWIFGSGNTGKIAMWTFRGEVVKRSQRQYLKEFKCII